MGADLRALVRPLFATPPDEFVAARNTLVKQLRADGDRDAAAAVAALRRPSWPDHVLDRSVDEHPDLVTAFLDAAAVTRDIQDAAVSGRRTGSLPDALRELRAAQSALAGVANRLLIGAGRPADPAGIGDRLGEVAASADASVQLRDGILGAGELGAGDATTADRPATRRGRASSMDSDEKTPPAKRRSTTEDDADAPDAPEERDDAAESERRAAEQAAEDARAAARAEREEVVRARRESVRLAATADTAVKRVTQQRDRAADSVTDAEQAVATAEEALDRARTALAALDAELAAAASAATTAHAQTAELDERLEELRTEGSAD